MATIEFTPKHNNNDENNKKGGISDSVKKNFFYEFGVDVSKIQESIEKIYFPFGKDTHDKFTNTKKKINFFINKTVYNQYYLEFINSPIENIIDIANNFSDEGISVRPAYVSAVLDCFFAKELESRGQ